MKKIAASILGKENKALLINKLIKEGIEIIHYDVMDGLFVPNTSLPLDEVLQLFNNTNPHYKDVHLMVQDPSKYIEKLIGFANQVSIHIESKTSVPIKEIILKYNKKIKLGLAINPNTNIEDVYPYIKDINHIMIMSVIPGKGGQKFIESSIEKISTLKKKILEINPNLITEIDGGINDVWGHIVFKKGVNIAVSGSYLINEIDNNSIEKILK